MHQEAAEAFTHFDQEKYTFARIVSCYGNSYKIITATDERLAKCSGKFSYKAVGNPAVGDWVVVTKANDYDEVIIHEILPRKSKMARAKVGDVSNEQMIATNIDYVLIVMALNDDYNLRRLERYLVAVWESGASPMIILNKEDLCTDLQSKIAAVQQIAFGVPIISLNATDHEQMVKLTEILKPNMTYVLVGSSGVGKSTIINYLLGSERQQIQAIRQGDDKGRHTTTARHLFYLNSGVCVIDTPGMREFGLLGSDAGVAAGFTDIHELATHCRFRDCKHQNEPECAVQAALLSGELNPKRFASYQKLIREEAYAMRKTDIRLQAEEKKKWKQIQQDYQTRIHKKR